MTKIIHYKRMMLAVGLAAALGMPCQANATITAQNIQHRAFQAIVKELHAPANCKMPAIIYSSEVIAHICQQYVQWAGYGARACYFNGNGSLLFKEPYRGRIIAIPASIPTVVFRDGFEPQNNHYDLRLTFHEFGRHVYGACLHKKLEGDEPQEILDLEQLAEREVLEI